MTLYAIHTLANGKTVTASRALPATYSCEPTVDRMRAAHPTAVIWCRSPPPWAIEALGIEPRVERLPDAMDMLGMPPRR